MTILSILRRVYFLIDFDSKQGVPSFDPKPKQTNQIHITINKDILIPL